jgi:molybdopterin-guanine dinucleotide biosynthesis protein B
MVSMLQVVGPSGSGKTLALEGAIRRLRARGLRVAVLKHSHHPLEVAGKDTDRLRRSGSDVVVFASDQCVVFSDWDPVELAHVLPVDVVLIEGFGTRRFPGRRFLVRRPEGADTTAAAIDRSVPEPGPRAGLKADGRRAPSGEMWELVGNLMRRSGIRRLELPPESLRRRAPRRTAHRSRPPRPSGG